MQAKRTIVTLCAVMGLMATQMALSQPSDQHVIVKNKAPLYADISYSYDLIFTIGGEESDYRLAVPYLILVDEEGSIFVADSNPWQILKYDARGNFVRRIGAPGEGPGEFTFIASMALTSDGELAVYDARQNRVQYFDLDGTVLRQVRLSTFALGATQMFVRDGEYYLSGTLYDMNSQRRLPSVWKYDREGTFVEAVFTDDTPSEKSFAYFAFDEQGSFYYLEPLDWFRYHIEKYDPEGTLQLVIERDNDPIKRSREEIERQTADVRAQRTNANSPILQALVANFKAPEYKKQTSRAWMHAKGHLLITTGLHDQEGYGIDIFDEGGKYLAQIPQGPSLPAVIKHDKIYQIETDPETGFRRVGVYAFEYELPPSR